MNKKTLALGLIAIILLIFVAKAAYDSLSGDQSATVMGIGFQLDGIKFEDGDPIPWGEISIDTTYYFNLTATNHSENNYTICFLSPGLPSGWLQTWDCNNTLLEAGTTMSGFLNLTATTLGEETWSWEITITKT